jgi:hypothetical protein
MAAPKDPEHERCEDEREYPEPERPGYPPSPPYCPPLRIPDRLDETALGAEVGVRLAGAPADGTDPPEQIPDKVIWVDKGDEVLVHLDSITTRVLDRMLLVSVDLETDQTGRATLVVPFAVGGGGDPAGLIAVTDELPRGNGLLASRWGEAVQAAVWATLLGIASDHAKERASSPLGITAFRGALNLHAGPALSAKDLMNGKDIA